MSIQCRRCDAKNEPLTMSRFNTDMICMNCETKEMKHSDYEKAKQAELEQVKQGNYNYKGIGKPEDL